MPPSSEALVRMDIDGGQLECGWRNRDWITRLQCESDGKSGGEGAGNTMKPSFSSRRTLDERQEISVGWFRAGK